MYKVIYEDGTEFKGGEPENSLWNNIEDKPIAEVQYTFKGETIIMSGLEAYNHQVKWSKFIFGRQQLSLINVMLMGKKNSQIHVVVWDLIHNILTGYTTVEGKELKDPVFENKKLIGWRNGRSTTGWKRGIQGGKSRIIRL